MSVEELEWCERCHANVLPETEAPDRVCPRCGRTLGPLVDLGELVDDA